MIKFYVIKSHKNVLSCEHTRAPYNRMEFSHLRPFIVIALNNFSHCGLFQFYRQKNAAHGNIFWKYDRQGCQKNVTSERIYIRACDIFMNIFQSLALPLSVNFSNDVYRDHFNLTKM